MNTFQLTRAEIIRQGLQRDIDWQKHIIAYTPDKMQKERCMRAIERLQEKLNQLDKVTA